MRLCQSTASIDVQCVAGSGEIPGLTDTEKPRQRGPKRASKIRKLFNLSKDDDVRKYVNTYRTVKEKDGKKHSKAPKIQRLVTPLTLQRKRHRRAIKRERINKVLPWSAVTHAPSAAAACRDPFKSSEMNRLPRHAFQLQSRQASSSIGMEVSKPLVQRSFE